MYAKLHQKVLALYHKRGSAEAPPGEVKLAVDVPLPSTDLSNSTDQFIMAHNEASLLLSLYAYQVLHGMGRMPGIDNQWVQNARPAYHE